MSSMESDFPVSSVRQPISNLSKDLMIGGVVLTILSAAVLATFFFGHYIPITDVQHFLSKIHQIPNMTWYVTAGGSVLGASALTCMIRSVVSNRKNKKNRMTTHIITYPTSISTTLPTRKNKKNRITTHTITHPKVTIFSILKNPITTFPTTITKKHIHKKTKPTTLTTIQQITIPPTTPPKKFRLKTKTLTIPPTQEKNQITEEEFKKVITRSGTFSMITSPCQT